MFSQQSFTNFLPKSLQFTAHSQIRDHSAKKTKKSMKNHIFSNLLPIDYQWSSVSFSPPPCTPDVPYKGGYKLGRYKKISQNPDFLSRLRRDFGYPFPTKPCVLMFLECLVFQKHIFHFASHSPNLKNI